MNKVLFQLMFLEFHFIRLCNSISLAFDRGGGWWKPYRERFTWQVRKLTHPCGLFQGHYDLIMKFHPRTLIQSNQFPKAYFQTP